MRRSPPVVASVVLLALVASGCVSTAPDALARDVEVREAAIQLAFSKALRAETDEERELWTAEYERRSHALTQYLDAVHAERTARVEHWRELSQNLQQAGLYLLQEALWPDGS
jgi:hypothetical protein